MNALRLLSVFALSLPFLSLSAKAYDWRRSVRESCYSYCHHTQQCVNSVNWLASHNYYSDLIHLCGGSRNVEELRPHSVARVSGETDRLVLDRNAIDDLTFTPTPTSDPSMPASEPLQPILDGSQAAALIQEDAQRLPSRTELQAD